MIAREAAEQSGRGVVPEIREPIIFNEALVAASRDHDICLFFNIGAPPLIAQGSIVSAGLFIGPEGGWAEEELIQAREYDVRETGLGVLTLRAETAAIIATYLVSHSQS